MKANQSSIVVVVFKQVKSKWQSSAIRIISIEPHPSSMHIASLFHPHHSLTKVAQPASQPAADALAAASKRKQ